MRNHIPFEPSALHIPDGFLSVAVSIAGWALAIAAIAFALRQTRGQMGEKQIPLMGVLAAFIFAAQAINFPVLGGTSGHLLGGTLAAIVMGPWAAVLIMTSVIAIQALVFQDGGLVVLGFNIVNMGIITAFTGHLVYTWLKRLLGEGRNSILLAGAVGAWLSVVLGAMATAIELAASGTTPLGVSLSAMTLVHALIGIGEAFITVGALAFVYATRRDLLNIGETAPAQASANWSVIGLLIALAVAAFSPLASGDPDGLNRVAADLGFDLQALSAPYEILSGYTIPLIGNETVSKIIAVGAGTLIVFGVVFVAARLQRKKAAV
ncbi:MAG TPA: energy-coupling factor ABC transporter permease [Anaerolineales bacterium]|nr:energy-coupling factor ABC transporter permease [Anaerolineales bacterium]